VNILSLSKYPQNCVGVSLGKVAIVFGKHVHPTGHWAPIMVLSGSGIPDPVSDSGVVELVWEYSRTTVVVMKSTKEIIKRNMATPSI
jgi:hypothetical protein